MKNYISQEEGVWFSLVNYTPTEEQSLILKTIPATEEDAILKTETLDQVIDDLIRRAPYAFGEKTLRDYHRKINMTRHMGFRKID